MRTIIGILLFHVTMAVTGQDFSGNFDGFLEGEAVTLDLKRDVSDNYTGLLNDSHNNFNIDARIVGNRLNGTATEVNSGLVFQVIGSWNGDLLELALSFELLGERSEIKTSLHKRGSGNSSSNRQDSYSSNNVLPQVNGASHDLNLVGRWTKNETYNSGYGDNFMGGNFSESMIFHGDGSLSSGGSSNSISGSNYYGSSANNTAEKIANISWYNIGNQLYLQIVDQGKAQQAHLGKYYIEGNNMLITSTSGEKLLLSR